MYHLRAADGVNDRKVTRKASGILELAINIALRVVAQNHVISVLSFVWKRKGTLSVASSGPRCT